MLGAQPRINPSKRLQEIEDRAKRLSQQVGYVSEMNRFCSQLVHTTENMLKLMDENPTGDHAFSDRIAEMNGAAHAKVQQCDAWLLEWVPKLKKMTDELSGGK